MKSSGNKVRILLVEDDEDDYVLITDYLREIKSVSFEVQWISDFQSALAELKNNRHDLYIFDYLLGSHTGLELISYAGETGDDCPVILLTGKGDQSIDREAMRLGADDYLVKGEIDPEKLERSLRYALERSGAMRALKESEEKYKNIFDRSRDMIYVTDHHGKFIDFNDSASRIFGYTREEFYLMNAIDLYESKEDRKKFLEALHKTGVISDFEITLKDKSGNKKFCIVSGSIQKLNSEGNIYYHGIIHDATRRKKAERTLVIAEKLALTGRVVRALAHEVRNPLTNINLAIEHIAEELHNQDHERYIDIIKRNSRRINELISELLQTSDFTDIRTGKYFINQLMDETLELAADRILLKNIEVIKKYSPDISEIIADREKLKIAFLNIIMNAIEAMPENGGVLTLETLNREGKCLVSIKDNGSGISKKNLGRLFEPFFSEKPNGVGLGLATTHSILQSHHASVQV